MTAMDALALANKVDADWHDQPRAFEREAVTRFWGLLTLPARVLDAERPSAMLQQSKVLRNARFKGDFVRGMFFRDQEFTEVDAIFLMVGSSLGHEQGRDAWVVEVERKSSNHQGDYYVARQRAKRFSDLLGRTFMVNARPVVIYEDDGGRFDFQRFEDGVLFLSMTALRQGTAGLGFPSIEDIPGLSSDKVLVKLALLRRLVASDPNLPGWYPGPLAFARAIENARVDLHLPVVGHQDTGGLPATVADWLKRARETDEHLGVRIDRYLQELMRAGMLERINPAPRLSLLGGQVVLQLLRAESEGVR